MSDQPIKSVQRIFEILEMFDTKRRPLAAKEIAKQLGYPLMSAHELFKSMNQLGYVDFNPADRTYMPSQAFTALLDWAHDNVDRETNILEFIKSISEASKETINLSRRVDSQAKIIHGIESQHAVGVSVKVGTTMPLIGSLTGISLLACMDSTEMEDYLLNLKNNDIAQSKMIDSRLIDDFVGELNDQGMVLKTDVFINGIGAICVPVRATSHSKNEPFIIGIVGPSERILEHQTEHRKTIKKLATQHQLKTVFKLRMPRKKSVHS